MLCWYNLKHTHTIVPFYLVFETVQCVNSCPLQHVSLHSLHRVKLKVGTWPTVSGCSEKPQLPPNILNDKWFTYIHMMINGCSDSYWRPFAKTYLYLKAWERPPEGKIWSFWSCSQVSRQFKDLGRGVVCSIDFISRQQASSKQSKWPLNIRSSEKSFSNSCGNVTGAFSTGLGHSSAAPACNEQPDSASHLCTCVPYLFYAPAKKPTSKTGKSNLACHANAAIVNSMAPRDHPKSLLWALTAKPQNEEIHSVVLWVLWNREVRIPHPRCQTVEAEAINE